MSTTAMRFDLDLVEIPVTIGKDEYILKEASEDAVCKYRNAVFKNTKLGPDGKPSAIGDMADVQPLLVSLCLYEKYDHKGEKKERLVSLNKVRSFSSKIVRKLFDKVKEISEIDDGDTVENLEKQKTQLEEKIQKLKDESENVLKNELDATTDISE